VTSADALERTRTQARADARVDAATSSDGQSSRPGIRLFGGLPGARSSTVDGEAMSPGVHLYCCRRESKAPRHGDGTNITNARRPNEVFWGHAPSALRPLDDTGMR
jgi:hypothetical protein